MTNVSILPLPYQDYIVAIKFNFVLYKLGYNEMTFYERINFKCPTVIVIGHPMLLVIDAEWTKAPAVCSLPFAAGPSSTHQRVTWPELLRTLIGFLRIVVWKMRVSAHLLHDHSVLQSGVIHGHGIYWVMGLNLTGEWLTCIHYKAISHYLYSTYGL